MVLTRTVYVKDGKPTFDPKDAKVAYVNGAAIDDEVAEKLGLPALFEQADKDAVEQARVQNDPFASLEAATPAKGKGRSAAPGGAPAPTEAK